MPLNKEWATRLALAYQHQCAGRLTEAESEYRAVLLHSPNYPAALHGLGVVNHLGGRHEEAIALLRKAVSVAPQTAEFRSNLAVVLGHVGRHGEAAAELREAVRFKGDYAEGWCNLGVALEKAGKADEAIDAYTKAIQLKPAYAQAHNFLGNALRRLGRLKEAEEAHRAALRLDEAAPGTWASLAATLSGQGRLREVVECRRKVVELRPQSAAAHSALLATLHYDNSYSPQQLLAEARTWAARHGSHFADDLAAHPNDRSTERRLRVGFLSGNLTAHPEGRLLRPVLAHLDREAFETFVYSSVGRGDGVTQTLRQLCDTWRDTDAMRDPQVAAGIREDKIDILVDLSGHFGNNRMQLLARKPAPVQVIHFGYPGTSGMEQVDWRLTDTYADPASGASDAKPAEYTSERLMYIADLAWCYEPPLEARAVGALPAKRRGYITFCCANNTIKITEQAVELWARILKEVPRSRLQILAEGNRRAKANQQSGEAEDERGRYLLEQFAAAGVESERVMLVPRQPRGKYFEWIHEADIALDPFPYNGGVTSCDTLWMGVPLVTLCGNSYWSRQGVALLSNAGLNKLIADTPQQYVELAVALARNLDDLAQLRQGLRGRLANSPVTDCVGFAQKLGHALRDMWGDWCRASNARHEFVMRCKS